MKKLRKILRMNRKSNIPDTDSAEQLIISKIKDESDPNTANQLYANYRKETRKDTRLVILKRILYFGGIFYLCALIAIFAVTIIKGYGAIRELPTIVNLLTPALTTIIGVIIGSSID